MGKQWLYASGPLRSSANTMVKTNWTDCEPYDTGSFSQQWDENTETHYRENYTLNGARVFMETCQCGHTDFVELPLLIRNQDEKGRFYDSQAYCHIAHRTGEIQTICEAWMKVERRSPKRQRNSSLRRLTGEEKAAQRKKESYDAMTDEEKAWYNAAGDWLPWLDYIGKKENFTSQLVYNDRFHSGLQIRLKMCTSCGASTTYSNIDEKNRFIDALLPLAQQKLASVVAEEKTAEKVKENYKRERQVAGERVNELKKQLAAAEQAHDSANEQVGDGQKNLSKPKNLFGYRQI